MPRTVEHIVSCHKVASALRAAGKPIWSRHIDIKAILHEDQANTSPEHIAAISVRVAALLRAHLPASVFDFGSDDFDADLIEAVEAMEECSVSSLDEDAKNGVEPVEMFNGWLESIYDWADANRIWVG